MSNEYNNQQQTSLVIFGASGDLTWRKLVPSLFHLYCKDRLPQDFNVVGLARSAFSDDDFREHLRQGVEQFAPNYDEAKCDAFSRRLWYVPGNFDEIDDYETLKEKLAAL